MPSPQRLEKITLQSYTPGTPGQPGSPGQAYQPERRVWQTYEVCSYVPYTQFEIEQILAAQGWRYVSSGPPDYRSILVPGPGAAGSAVQIPTGRYVCRTETRIEVIPAVPYIPPRPAVPGTPGSTSRDFQLGWNARARSIRVMSASGRFSFQIPSSVVAVIVGLTPDPRSTGFSDIGWAFRVTAGVLSILEDGVEVQSIGLHDSADVLSIQRSLGEITYLVDDVAVRTVPAGSPPMYLSAALYSGGDAVYEASLIEFSDGVGDEAMSPIQAFGGTEPYAIGTELMEPMQAFGGSYGTGFGAGVMEPLVAFGAGLGGYAIGIGVLEPMTAEGESIEELVYAIGSGIMQPLLATGAGLTGTVGGANAILEPMQFIGADAGGYAQASQTMDIVFDDYGYSPLVEGDINLISLGIAQDSASLNSILFIVLNSTMEVETVFVAESIAPVDIFGSVNVTDSLDTITEIGVELMSYIRGLASDQSGSEKTVWALSLDSNGLTRYENYEFNSFARINGKNYAARFDGVFLLEGDDDDGQNIGARINLGKPNFGSDQRKAMPLVYVGVAGNDQLVLKVVGPDGKAYYYQSSGYSSETAQHRLQPGRGLSAVHFDVELMNIQGSDMRINNIQFVPVNLARRI